MAVPISNYTISVLFYSEQNFSAIMPSMMKSYYRKVVRFLSLDSFSLFDLQVLAFYEVCSLSYDNDMRFPNLIVGNNMRCVRLAKAQTSLCIGAV